MASVLEEEGFEGKVKILDSRAIGATFDTLRDVVRRWRPEIVGFQVKTPNYQDSVLASRICKEEGVPYVVWGGHHASPLAKETARLPDVDVVFRGEAEYTFRDFVVAVEEGKDWRKTQGITYQDKSGKVQSNPDAPLIKDLDAIPFPARHLLPLDKYKIFGSSFPATTMITSRGCPYACEFCSVTSFYGHRWRTRSAENIAAEMQSLVEDHDLLAVAFVDDLFFVNKKRVFKIAREIQRMEANLSREIYWGATVRADRTDIEMLKAMRNANCRLVFAGVESYDQAILDSVKKRTQVSEIEDFHQACKKARLDTLSSFSFGFPGETIQTVRRTIRWAIDVLDPSLAIFTISTPYPGTPFFDQMEQEGRIFEKDYSKYTLFNPILELTGISREELKKEVVKAYKEFYVRPRKMYQNVKREMSYAVESYGLRMFLDNLRVAIRGAVHFAGVERNV